jgi:hypothetical protein
VAVRGPFARVKGPAEVEVRQEVGFYEKATFLVVLLNEH